MINGMGKGKTEIVYRETLTSPGNVIMIVICIVGIIVLFSYFGYVGKLLDWANQIMLLVCILALLYFSNFSRFKISVTTDAIAIRYGILKRVFYWGDIVDCYPFIFDPDKEGNISSIESNYPVVRSGRKMIYHINLITFKGRKHVVLRLKRGQVDEFVFLSNKPDEVIDLVRKHIGKQVKQETIA